MNTAHFIQQNSVSSTRSAVWLFSRLAALICYWMNTAHFIQQNSVSSTRSAVWLFSRLAALSRYWMNTVYFIQQNSWPSKRSAATCARGFKPLRPRWKCKSALCLIFPRVQNGPFCVCVCVCVCTSLLLSIFLVFEWFLAPYFIELLMFYC